MRESLESNVRVVVRASRTGWTRIGTPVRLVLRQYRRALLLACLTCMLRDAYALPSFARQTGQRCAACHVGGDWPQLTRGADFSSLPDILPESSSLHGRA